MTRSTFHYRQVDRSPELQRIVEVLKQASAPISSLEIMHRIKEQYGLDALNISTGIGEIRQNDGYSVTKGDRKIDGHYRYILLAAPGWTPTWQAAAAAALTSRNVQDAQELPTPMIDDSPRPPRICRLERCFTEIPESGPPFCCNEHREEYFQQGKV